VRQLKRAAYGRVYHFISVRYSMTADTHLRLQQRLGVSAYLRMNLQERYGHDVAAEKGGAENE
jgi:plasmid maintenance system antidote protein VapI